MEYHSDFATVDGLFTKQKDAYPTPHSVISQRALRRGPLVHADFSAASDPLILAQYRVRLLVQCALERAGECAGITGFAAEIEKGRGPEDGDEGEPVPPEVLELHMDDMDTFRIHDAVERALPRMAAVRAAGGTVMVNCAAGRSRSAAVVLAHLMDFEGLSLADAFRTMRTARPYAYPNVGFVVQLMRRELLSRGECSIPPTALRGHEMYAYVFDSDADGQDYITTALVVPHKPAAAAVAAAEEAPAEASAHASAATDGASLGT